MNMFLRSFFTWFIVHMNKNITLTTEHGKMKPKYRLKSSSQLLTFETLWPNHHGALLQFQCRYSATKIQIIVLKRILYSKKIHSRPVGKENASVQVYV